MAQTFKIYLTFNAVPANAIVSFNLGTSDLLSWTDTARNASTPITTENSTYFYDYPTDAVSVVNNNGGGGGGSDESSITITVPQEAIPPVTVGEINKLIGQDVVINLPMLVMQMHTLVFETKDFPDRTEIWRIVMEGDVEISRELAETKIKTIFIPIPSNMTQPSETATVDEQNIEPQVEIIQENIEVENIPTVSVEEIYQEETIVSLEESQD